MANGELFLATDLLEACRGWQEVINGIPDKEAKDEAGQHAVTSLHTVDGYHGEHTVIVKTDVALMLADGSSQEEMIWPMLRFNDMRLMGNLGKVAYVSLNGQGLISWRLIDAKVVDPTPEPTILDDITSGSEAEFQYYLPVERNIRRPLYIPVSLIDYALPAAN